MLHAVDDGHFIDQLRVGKGGPHGGEVVAAVGGVGVEVLLGQAHARQVFARGAVGQDGVGGRQVVGGDVVGQQGQWPHVAQRAREGRQRAHAFGVPVRRAADVGGLRAPFVLGRGFVSIVLADGEHGFVDGAELRRFDRLLDDGVDLLVGGPQVLEADLAAVHHGQHVLLDVEADGARQRIGHDQRRRGQEGLFGLGMDAPVEVAVAREHGRGVEVALDDFLLDGGVQRAAHAVAGGAGKGDDAKAQLLQLGEQPGLFQVQLHGLGARRQRGLDPGLAHQSKTVGVARQQGGGDDVARVAGVGAAGDGGDDDGPIGHQALRLLGAGGLQFGRIGNAALGQGRGGQAPVRIRGTGHVAHHGGQVELQHALVPGIGQAVAPETCGARIGLDQAHLGLVSASQAQVGQGLVVNGEHGRRGAVFGAHVGDGGAVTDAQAVGALAKEFHIGAHHLLLAQEFGQGQHDVGGGDAALAPAREAHAHDLGHAHP